MKTVRNACQLQPKALEINVGDQIEQLDQIINDTNGHEYFKKTFITDGFKTLNEGEKVSFNITRGPKGDQASNIVLL